MGRIVSETAIIFQDDNMIERNNKEKEYLDYINEHISNVVKCYNSFFVPLLSINTISTKISDTDLKNAITNLGTYINTHDASKFSDSEFDPYRQRYYPTTKEINADDTTKELIIENYERAWKHHYETNAHHPEHWFNHDTNVPVDMTLEAILEMICDWEAMSLKFGTNTLNWYETKAIDEKKCMTSNTKDIVDELLYNVVHKTTVDNEEPK